MTDSPALTMDLGELAHEPEALYACTDVAMIACGAHAGDAQSIERALRYAKRYGCEVGVHPGYPDRANFGRVPLALSSDELYECCRAQCEWLLGAAQREGVEVRWLKFHGALYHLVHSDARSAQAALDGVFAAFAQSTVPSHAQRSPLCVAVSRHDSALAQQAAASGVSVRLEAFADRAVRPDGSLVPRDQPGAVLQTPEQVRARVAAILLQPSPPALLCLHGDHPFALQNARVVRQLLGPRVPT